MAHIWKAQIWVWWQAYDLGADKGDIAMDRTAQPRRESVKKHLWKIPHDHNMEHLTPPVEGQLYKVQTILEILAGVSLQMLYGHTEWGALLHMLLTNKEKHRVVRVSDKSDCSNYENGAA